MAQIKMQYGSGERGLPKITLAIVDNDVVLEPSMFTVYQMGTGGSSGYPTVNNNVMQNTFNIGLFMWFGNSTSSLYNLFNEYYSRGYRKLKIEINVDVVVGAVKNNRRLTYRSVSDSSVQDVIVGEPGNRDSTSYSYNFVSNKIDLVTGSNQTPSLLIWEQQNSSSSQSDYTSMTATFHKLKIIFMEK